MANEHFTRVVLPSEYTYRPTQDVERRVWQHLADEIAGTGERLTRIEVPATSFAVPGNDHLHQWEVKYWTEPVEPEAPQGTAST